jgi:hypothetical protein
MFEDRLKISIVQLFLLGLERARENTARYKAGSLCNRFFTTFPTETGAPKDLKFGIHHRINLLLLIWLFRSSHLLVLVYLLLVYIVYLACSVTLSYQIVHLVAF